MVPLEREVRYQLIPNVLYQFDAADREVSVLLINTLSEKREEFT